MHIIFNLFLQNIVSKVNLFDNQIYFDLLRENKAGKKLSVQINLLSIYYLKIVSYLRFTLLMFIVQYGMVCIGSREYVLV